MNLAIVRSLGIMFPTTSHFDDFILSQSSRVDREQWRSVIRDAPYSTVRAPQKFGVCINFTLTHKDSKPVIDLGRSDAKRTKLHSPLLHWGATEVLLLERHSG